MSGYGTCPECWGELVYVDNPMRPEVRHRRGVECKPVSPEMLARVEEMLRDVVFVRPDDVLKDRLSREADARDPGPCVTCGTRRSLHADLKHPYERPPSPAEGAAGGSERCAE